MENVLKQPGLCLIWTFFLKKKNDSLVHNFNVIDSFSSVMKVMKCFEMIHLAKIVTLWRHVLKPLTT